MRESIWKYNTNATVIDAASPIDVDKPELIKGKRVLVVEDGPTVTHGSMPSGAGLAAAVQYGASEVVDPRPWAVGSLREVFDRYPHIGPVLPAMGYRTEQVEELAASITAVPCDLVLAATPIDLAGIVRVAAPILRVTYASAEIDGTPLADAFLGLVGGREREV